MWILVLALLSTPDDTDHARQTAMQSFEASKARSDRKWEYSQTYRGQVEAAQEKAAQEARMAREREYKIWKYGYPYYRQPQYQPYRPYRYGY